MTIKDLIQIVIGTKDTRWLSSWQHARFDFDHYGQLRDAGLTHKQACQSLDRMWHRQQEVF